VIFVVDKLAVHRPWWPMLAVALTVACAPSAAQDSRSPIHVHRVATGNLDGLKNAIKLSVEACRAVKNLPLGAPVPLPSDTYLAKLAVVEAKEYFDGANHATYHTVRRVAADPASGTCQLMLFHERSGWAGQMCGSATKGSSTSINKLLDYNRPDPAATQVDTVAAPRKGCGKKAKTYDVTGLPTENAGRASCVWDSDIIAKQMRAAGLKAEGHKKGSPAADFCLYARQPIYVHNGHHELVVLKSSGSTEGDALDQLLGENTAYLNDQLVDFSDGSPIPAERFSAGAVRSFVAQPAKTPLGEH
jgi:hypothetical protein